MSDRSLTKPLRIGRKMDKKELEQTFDTKFGYQIKGINIRANDDERYIILLSNEGEVYEDEIGTGNAFFYIGEGLPEKGDQRETPANRALINAIVEPLPIYLFTSEEGLDDYEYQ